VQARTQPQSSSVVADHYSRRTVLAFQYGSLAFAVIGLLWGLIFAAIGWWSVVALDIGIITTGLAIYLLIRRGRLAFGILAAQAALMVIAIIMGLMLDVPTADAPRVSHIYLLVLAALGYLNYQRGKSTAQLVLIGMCLLAFVVLASTPLATPLAVTMPDGLRIAGSWANTIVATTMLAACIHAMQAEFTRKDRFARDLMAAVWKDEFQLAFQPQVDLSRNTIGAEALLRWNSPSRGAVSPAEFIPEAERLGLMVAIGGWVLEQGCTTLARWQKDPGLRHLSLSVNVSASQLMHEDFEELVRDTLEKTRAEPRRLVLELTESVLVTDIELVIARLKALRALGITLSLDDFGTGYSSLSYLQRLPIQQVKIDRSFVQDAVDNPASASLVNNIVLMSRDLGHTVLAEGVETSEQHELLARSGCIEFQGYLYGRPMPLAAFEQHIGSGDETDGSAPATGHAT